jgi:hypothetical protein
MGGSVASDIDREGTRRQIVGGRERGGERRVALRRGSAELVVQVHDGQSEPESRRDGVERVQQADGVLTAGDADDQHVSGEVLGREGALDS